MSKENTRGEHHTKYSLQDETRHDPMSFGEALKKVREGCERYMYLIDEEGQCTESDEYVVALHFFDTYLEELKSNRDLAKQVMESTADLF